jgi:hypothetical protein
MRTSVCLVAAAALLALSAGTALADVPEVRQATTPLGDPVECTADARGQVTTEPFAGRAPGLVTPSPLARPDGYVLADSIEAHLFLPAGERYVVHFDPDRRALKDTLLPYELTPTAVAAVEASPTWVRLDMENNLRQLSVSKQNQLGDVLLGLDDPRTIDEVAFQIAHLPKGVFTYGTFEPGLMEINAELMYAIDSELQFVEIVDYDLGGGDFYSTTRYRTVVEGDTTEIEIPPEMYYWWVMMPKVSDEMPLMDASVYNMFWREYLYYANDTGYPLLQEVMQPVEVLWDGIRQDWSGGRPFTDTMLAVDAIGNWCSETVPFAASGNRPIQPSQIAHEHDGNCGELQDLLCAAARTCLIPCACAMDILEDHVWCEMWLEDWYPYQIDLGGGPTHIANPGIAYDSDYGGGKDVSCIWSWRNDGYTYDVVSRYSQVCTLSVYVEDLNGVPVDNAGVIIASEFYYSPYALYRGTWGETGKDGTVRFILGNNQNYYVQVLTSVGNYPATGYASIITGSVPGEHYYWSWTAPDGIRELNMVEVAPGIDAPFVIEVEYELPYDVQSGRDYYASPAGWYAENLPDGSLTFFIADQPNYGRSHFNLQFDAYAVSQGASSHHVQFHVPSVEEHFVVFSGDERHGLTARGDFKVRLWIDDTVGVPDNADVASVSLSRPSPNPLSRTTTLAFSIAERGLVALAVYDARGALVRRIVNEALPPGSHERAWDGRNDEGCPVASGVYFARLEAEGATDERKVVVLR